MCSGGMPWGDGLGKIKVGAVLLHSAWLARRVSTDAAARARVLGNVVAARAHVWYGCRGVGTVGTLGDGVVCGVGTLGDVGDC